MTYQLWKLKVKGRRIFPHDSRGMQSNHMHQIPVLCFWFSIIIQISHSWCTCHKLSKFILVKCKVKSEETVIKYDDYIIFSGKNDGSVKGVRYFKCRKAHGIFVRHDKLIMDKKRKSGKINKMSPSMRRSLGNLSSPSPQKENLPALTADNFTKSTSVDKKKWQRWTLDTSPWALEIHPMAGQCWATVADGGPALNRRWVSVSCLPGLIQL